MSVQYRVHFGEHGDAVPTHMLTVDNPEALRIVLELLDRGGASLAPRVLCDQTHPTLTAIDLANCFGPGASL